ncbi:hypothetical protein FDP22_17680 [Paroceanicella profunda]|uniref:Lipoprotein n=1 Tax=Paroceanicella profunda TaxID=2579971 RepID=A0A5B8G2P1_9RHOB|nr:hypothetical protein [Paroceanicella profunda]QDL93452.1 hypothetical protein FDP22_17680 [Paroceanicella profunda]
MTRLPTLAGTARAALAAMLLLGACAQEAPRRAPVLPEARPGVSDISAAVAQLREGQLASYRLETIAPDGSLTDRGLLWLEVVGGGDGVVNLLAWKDIGEDPASLPEAKREAMHAIATRQGRTAPAALDGYAVLAWSVSTVDSEGRLLARSDFSGDLEIYKPHDCSFTTEPCSSKASMLRGRRPLTLEASTTGRMEGGVWAGVTRARISASPSATAPAVNTTQRRSVSPDGFPLDIITYTDTGGTIWRRTDAPTPPPAEGA